MSYPGCPEWNCRLQADGAPCAAEWLLSTGTDFLHWLGPLARSVECAAILDAVMAAEPDDLLADVTVRGLRFAVPKTLVLDDLELPIASAFQSVCSALSGAGATVLEIELPQLSELRGISSKGGFAAAESMRGTAVSSLPAPMDMTRASCGGYCGGVNRRRPTTSIWSPPVGA